MKDQIEQVEIQDLDPFDVIDHVLPRSAREKMESTAKSEGEPPTGLFKLNRRDFLKASAIAGSLALIASNGLIHPQPAAAAAEIGGNKYIPAPAYAPGEVVKVENAADAFIKLLQAYNVDYLFWGTDDEIAPVVDKLTPLVIAKKPPHPIMGLNEFAAVAMAHGYAAVSEKVAVAMYGACQGPMNSHGAIYNAYMSRAPVLIVSALNANDGLPYCGQYWIDPGDLVREYTKWTNHFPNGSNLPAEFIHGYATAATYPQGPCLLSTFHNAWLQKMPDDSLTLPNPAKLSPPRAAVPNATSIKEVADLLVNAKNPLIIAGDLGRVSAAVTELVKLAELLGAPVIESHGSFTGFPWNHPLHQGFSSTELLKTADVVFVVEGSAPTVAKGAKLIMLDVDPVRAHALSSAGRLRETDVRLLGESKDTLAALRATIGTSELLKKRADEAIIKWNGDYTKLREAWKAATAKHLNDNPISEWRLADEVSKIMTEKTILFGWTYHSRSKVLYPGVQTNYPKSYIYTLGGSHLGQTLYGAIGAQLAAPDKQVIAVSGDLEWHMGHGGAALWSAAHHNVPVLYVIVNNHEMSQTKSGQMNIKGEGVTLNNWWAQEIFPPMSDYSQLAKAYGIYGECVKDPNEVGPALKRGLDAVAKNKQPALLDIWTASVVGIT
ncbi:MAG: twin-arginine translocation signal domain-containing protein [Chloroflexi bacterium]|nr:twin-arginine translocation signal domain-containing protein [Chloroflexota bacterium]